MAITIVLGLITDQGMAFPLRKVAGQGLTIFDQQALSVPFAWARIALSAVGYQTRQVEQSFVDTETIYTKPAGETVFLYVLKAVAGVPWAATALAVMHPLAEWMEWAKNPQDTEKPQMAKQLILELPLRVVLAYSFLSLPLSLFPAHEWGSAAVLSFILHAGWNWLKAHGFLPEWAPYMAIARKQQKADNEGLDRQRLTLLLRQADFLIQNVQSHFIIREARMSDFERIKQLHNMKFPAGPYIDSMHDEIYAWEDHYKNTILHQGLDRDSRLYVAEDRETNTVAGYGFVVGSTYKYSLIAEMVVDPHYRNAGIGKALFGKKLSFLLNHPPYLQHHVMVKDTSGVDELPGPISHIAKDYFGFIEFHPPRRGILTNDPPDYYLCLLQAHTDHLQMSKKALTKRVGQKWLPYRFASLEADPIADLETFPGQVESDHATIVSKPAGETVAQYVFMSLFASTGGAAAILALAHPLVEWVAWLKDPMRVEKPSLARQVMVELPQRVFLAWGFLALPLSFYHLMNPASWSNHIPQLICALILSFLLHSTWNLLKAYGWLPEWAVYMAIDRRDFLRSASLLLKGQGVEGLESALSGVPDPVADALVSYIGSLFHTASAMNTYQVPEFVRNGPRHSHLVMQELRESLGLDGLVDSRYALRRHDQTLRERPLLLDLFREARNRYLQAVDALVGSERLGGLVRPETLQYLHRAKNPLLLDIDRRIGPFVEWLKLNHVPANIEEESQLAQRAVITEGQILRDYLLERGNNLVAGRIRQQLDSWNKTLTNVGSDAIKAEDTFRQVTADLTHVIDEGSSLFNYPWESLPEMLFHSALNSRWSSLIIQHQIGFTSGASQEKLRRRWLENPASAETVMAESGREKIDWQDLPAVQQEKLDVERRLREALARGPEHFTDADFRNFTRWLDLTHPRAALPSQPGGFPALNPGPSPWLEISERLTDFSKTQGLEILLVEKEGDVQRVLWRSPGQTDSWSMLSMEGFRPLPALSWLGRESKGVYFRSIRAGTDPRNLASSWESSNEWERQDPHQLLGLLIPKANGTAPQGQKSVPSARLAIIGSWISGIVVFALSYLNHSHGGMSAGIAIAFLGTFYFWHQGRRIYDTLIANGRTHEEALVEPIGDARSGVYDLEMTPELKGLVRRHEPRVHFVSRHLREGSRLEAVVATLEDMFVSLVVDPIADFQAWQAARPKELPRGKSFYLRNPDELKKEKAVAKVVGEELRKPLIGIPGDPEKHARMVELYPKGGYQQNGYGMPLGAAINGSEAFEGSQGYYAKSATGEEVGKATFLEGVATYRRFFERHRARGPGHDILAGVKPGIGGQHTPFAALADIFTANDPGGPLFTGEYELGKDVPAAIRELLKQKQITWNQLLIAASSKSGRTAESMMIFASLMHASLIPNNHGIDADRFADLVFDLLHEINFPDGKEADPAHLFRVNEERFGTTSLITLVYERARQAGFDVSRDMVRQIFVDTLGHMVFETTPNPLESRLAAFLEHSGLRQELGADAPGYVQMYENVGGRWTADLHMMMFLAYYNLDAEAYWNIRRKEIEEIRAGTSFANLVGDQILDEGVEEIALIVPKNLYWFGKSIEQNFNESLWQSGSPILRVYTDDIWPYQKQAYENSTSLVINLSDTRVESTFRQIFFDPELGTPDKQKIAEHVGRLYSFFYGVTTTIGSRLLARALIVNINDFDVRTLNLNDLEDRATRIVQQNLHFRQPLVELGKRSVEDKFAKLQAQGAEAVRRDFQDSQEAAQKGAWVSNVQLHGLGESGTAHENLSQVLEACLTHADADSRDVVPLLYRDGTPFHEMRVFLSKLTLRDGTPAGVKWVLQGSGDQHVNVQKKARQQRKFLPLIVSFVPETELPGMRANGFIEYYLDGVSPHHLNDAFSMAIYTAFTHPDERFGRGSKGGQAVHLRWPDTPEARAAFMQAYREAVQRHHDRKSPAANPPVPIRTRMLRTFG